jgi:phospholipid/cholesterol/gamma-HCH transport system substrate-binding protein
MEPKENRRALITGIFLTLGLIIFIVGVFTLGGSNKAFSKNIHVNAVFSDVQGLKPGNNVWFSGVKVGTIGKMNFVGVGKVSVILTVDPDAQHYIHKNSGVRISSDGFIGNKIIIIEGGTPDAPIVAEGDTLQAEKQLSTDDIEKTLQDNNKNLLAITNDFKQLSHNILQGKGTVGALLADSSMAMQLKSAMRNLQTTTQTAAQMADQLDAFSKKLNTKGGLADKLFTDTVTFNKIKASVDEFQKTVTNANGLVQNLNTASKQLITPNNAIGVLLMDPKGAEQVRTSLNNLRQSSIKLNEDLEAAQHNIFLKGYFKKKEKAKEDSLKNGK